MILNFRRVLIVVSFLLGKSPASVYYCMPTFRNSLSVPSSKAMVEHSIIALEDGTESSETSAYNNTLTPGTYPKEKKLQDNTSSVQKKASIVAIGFCKPAAQQTRNALIITP